MRTKTLVAAMALLWCGTPDRAAWSGPPTEMLTVAGFGQVALYAPRAAPSQVVLFVSGDGGWNLGVVPMAEALSDRGALVVGIDIRAFVKTLNAAGGCAYPAGDLERLSRTVQLKRRLTEYKAPVLVGYSSGATLVYAALAAAPPETFAGAISLGFCPDLELSRPPCEQNGLRVSRRTNAPASTWLPISKREHPGWCCKVTLIRCVHRKSRVPSSRPFLAASCSLLRKSDTGSPCLAIGRDGTLAAYDAIVAHRASRSPCRPRQKFGISL